VTAAIRAPGTVSFWIAPVVRQDQYHEPAQVWALRITGRLTTTWPVLLETANALARPA
jgi:predicted nucleic acid-binding protein